MATSLVDAHPLVKEVDSKLADHARRKADFEARVAPLAEQDAAAEEAYAQAVDAALLEGKPMPRPPVRRLPEGRDVELRQSFMLELQLLNEERRRAVAAVYDDVLAQASSQAKELGKDARPILEKLLAVMGEVGSLLHAVRICRDANLEGRRYPDDAQLTLVAFATLVASGGDPTHLLHLPGAPRALPSSRDGLTRADIQQLIERRRRRPAG
jgi:hypothetical protein